jgi:CheY-like chemotaxis protein
MWRGHEERHRPECIAVIRPRVLCVDDEPDVLDGLRLHLRKRFNLVTETSGPRGLERLAREQAFQVVFSDMRMPGMDGAQFLSRVSELYPDTVRVMLTGGANLDSAIAAVNEGHVFRFLTKPCPPDQLLKTLDAAVEQYRLVTSERELLEKTLHGSVKVLTDVLALTNAVAFGRATRLRKNVSDICDELEVDSRWQIEVAAMVSQLGSVTLPEKTAEKLYVGETLSPEEEKLVSRLPSIVAGLLGNIPRLEPVLDLLAGLAAEPERVGVKEDDESRRDLGVEILRIARDYDVLESTGLSSQATLDTMRGRGDFYDASALAALSLRRGVEATRQEIREIPVGAIREGMVVASDVRTETGTLLVARGYEVTAGFVARLTGFRRGYVHEPVRVILSNGS